jgi:hypothetical protein
MEFVNKNFHWAFLSSSFEVDNDEDFIIPRIFRLSAKVGHSAKIDTLYNGHVMTSVNGRGLKSHCSLQYQFPYTCLYDLA